MDSSEDMDEEDEESSRKQEKEDSLIKTYKDRLLQNDPTVIFKMFKLMLLKINQVQSKISSMEQKINKQEKAQSKVDKTFKKVKRDLQVQKKDLTELGESVYDVLQAVLKAELDSKSLASKVENLDVRISKGGITIKGLPEEKGENCKKIASSFFVQQLEIEQGLNIQTAYRLGKKNPKTKHALFVKLLDPNDVAIVFKNVSKLKGKTNSQDEHYFIDEQLTERANEDRRRKMEIRMDNQAMPMSHQLNIEMKGRDLHIDGKTYQKQVKPPTAK